MPDRAAGMRFTIVSNPRSGRGKARKLAEAIRELAHARGHSTQDVVVDMDLDLDEAPVDDCDRLVIVGGDGTVHHMLPKLAQTQTPFYHAGTGTANLISHAFGMSARPERVLEQLEQYSEPVRIDLPECNGHPFLIMTSMGMDASVIHRLEESRKLGGFRAYVRPILREVLKPRNAYLRVSVDGEPIDCRAGVLVVANLPNYGGHFNPCRAARCDDGRLDIANIRGTTSIGVGLRYLALLARLPAATTGCGSVITVEASRDSYVQMDGEKPKAVPAVLTPGARLEFRMTDGCIYAHAPRLARSS